MGILFDNNAAKNERGLTNQMGTTANAYQSYRPEQAQARTQALSQQLGAMNPINSALSSMYGPGAAVDTAALAQNPMSANMMGISGAQPQQQQAPRADKYDPSQMGTAGGIFAAQAMKKK